MNWRLQPVDDSLQIHPLVCTGGLEPEIGFRKAKVHFFGADLIHGSCLGEKGVKDKIGNLRGGGDLGRGLALKLELLHCEDLPEVPCEHAKNSQRRFSKL